jgi:hypothetical protein
MKTITISLLVLALCGCGGESNRTVYPSDIVKVEKFCEHRGGWLAFSPTEEYAPIGDSHEYNHPKYTILCVDGSSSVYTPGTK